MQRRVNVLLPLALGCCAWPASRLDGQVSGPIPGAAGNAPAPKPGDNRAWGLDQPRFRLDNHPAGMRSPADEVREVMQGGTILPAPVGGFQVPPPIKPMDIPVPPVKVQFPPPKDHSAEIGAISSLATTLGIVIASIMIGLARRRQERASAGSGSAASGVATEAAGVGQGGRSYIRLGADGRAGIMYR